MLSSSTFSCKCGQHGFCGPRCDIADPCLESPCSNGGECIENCGDVPDYRCNCTIGFAGKNCTEVVSVPNHLAPVRSLLLFLLSSFANFGSMGDLAQAQLSLLHKQLFTTPNKSLFALETGSLFQVNKVRHNITSDIERNESDTSTQSGYWFSFLSNIWQRFSINFLRFSSLSSSSYVCLTHHFHLHAHE